MNKTNSKLFSVSKKIKKKLFKEDIYHTYEEALRKCSNKGYENNDVITLVKAKAISYRENIKNAEYIKINPGVIALLDVAKRINANTGQLIIFDFGGADGIYYLQLRKCLPVEIKILWCVIETAEMVSGMKDFETEELKFFNSIKDAIIYSGRPPHIFHTSGTIQYTPDPIFFIKEICKSGSEFLIFNRQSISLNNKPIVSIQTSLLSWHGEGNLPEGFSDRVIKYPHTNVPKSEFEKIVLSDYEIIYTYDDSSGVKTVNKEKIVGLFYVCKLK